MVPVELVPDTRPAFRASTAVAGPNGTVWVTEDPPHAKSDSAVVAVIDARQDFGRIVARYLLPWGSTIVGFGENAVYVREVAGGLLKIRRD